jgi:hypothetical protein
MKNDTLNNSLSLLKYCIAGGHPTTTEYLPLRATQAGRPAPRRTQVFSELLCLRQATPRKLDAFRSLLRCHHRGAVGDYGHAAAGQLLCAVELHRQRQLLLADVERLDRLCALHFGRHLQQRWQCTLVLDYNLLEHCRRHHLHVQQLGSLRRHRDVHCYRGHRRPNGGWRSLQQLRRLDNVCVRIWGCLLVAVV